MHTRRLPAPFLHPPGSSSHFTHSTSPNARPCAPYRSPFAENRTSARNPRNYAGTFRRRIGFLPDMRRTLRPTRGFQSTVCGGLRPCILPSVRAIAIIYRRSGTDVTSHLARSCLHDGRPNAVACCPLCRTPYDRAGYLRLAGLAGTVPHRLRTFDMGAKLRGDIARVDGLTDVMQLRTLHDDARRFLDSQPRNRVSPSHNTAIDADNIWRSSLISTPMSAY